jgi:putative hydrolase of the HAD superfamily
MSLLSRFRVVLLDMNSTFMFGEDRFGDEEDFFATYRSVGGERLSPREVTRLIRSTFDSMAADYENPTKYDCFPQVQGVLRQFGAGVSEADLALVEQVFAIHELGTVGDEYATFIKKLAKTHRLGEVDPKNWTVQ